MKKYLSCLSLFVCMAFTGIAQSKTGLGVNDPAAKKILDGVSAKFKSFKNVQATFTLKIENAAGKNMGVKSGTVYMKGNKYRYSLSGTEVFSDGVNIWSLDKAAKEVTINKIDPSGSAITPQKLFTNFYDKDFLYRLNGEANGKQEIELTPLDKSKPYFKFLLYVNKAAQTLNSTKVFMNDGNRTTYSSGPMINNKIIPDDTFIFDIKKYPGVEVVDLR